MKAIFGRIWGLIRAQRAAFIGTLLCAFASSVLLLLGPWLLGLAIDALAGGVDFPRLLRVLVWLLCVYLLGTALQWLMLTLTNRIANIAITDLRKETFAHTLRIPLAWLDTRSRGDLLSRFTNDCDLLAEGIQQGLAQVIPGVITLAGTLIMLVRISPAITAVVVVITPLSLFIARFIIKGSTRMFRKQQSLLGELGGYAEEMIAGMKTVEVFGYAERAQKGFDAINRELYTDGQKAQFYGSLTNPATRFVNNIAYALVGIIGALLTLRGQLTVGGIASLLSYATQFAKPVNEVTNVATQLQSAYAAAERIFALLDAETESADRPGALRLEKARGAVRFADVDFAYTPDVPLIQGLTLDVPAGKRIAIVGPTGAGKTTLVNLLMRFYEVDSGVLSVDGHAVGDIERDSLRRSYAMVLQDSWLFTGTVRENIAYGYAGEGKPSDADIERAARAAHAHGFIRRLPQGYDTLIQADGENLSLGQKQLITIARAMLADPPMLILDEATSNVDTLTEARIQQAFEKLMEGKTSFVIAHRLGTIRTADRILVMQHGSIVEMGTHEELLALDGLYASLYRNQFAS